MERALQIILHTGDSNFGGNGITMYKYIINHIVNFQAFQPGSIFNREVRQTAINLYHALPFAKTDHNPGYRTKVIVSTVLGNRYYLKLFEIGKILECSVTRA